MHSKAAALIDMLEIGKRKYTELRLLCQPNFIIPTYISANRHQLVAPSVIETVKYIGYPVGVTMKYHKILLITT